MVKTFYLDFETTGLNIFHDDIIEYSIFEPDTKDTESNLVQLDKKKEVSEFITKLTGITKTDLIEYGVEFSVAVHNIKDFIIKHSTQNETVVLVAHNGDSFDFPIFRRLLKEFLPKMNRKIIYFDTMRFAQVLLPRVYKYSQANLCKIFEITNSNEHRASGDVEALYKIHKHMSKLYSSKYSCILEQHKYIYSKI